MPHVRIDHISLVVHDYRASLQFYQGILGLALADRPNLGFPGAWLQLDGQQIHLLQVPNPEYGVQRPAHVGRDRHLALVVSRLDPLVAALQAADIPYHFSQSGRRALFCRDPDGNGVELVERPETQADQAANDRIL